MKKRLFLLFAVLLAAVLCLPVAALETDELPLPRGSGSQSGYTPPADIGATAVYLYNIDTDTLIWQKNAHQTMYPASLTKIMTCILAMENTVNLDSETITYPTYVQDYLYTYQYVWGNGTVSSAGLLAGEELTMRQALYALMLPSGNEVAMCIADHIGGSQEGFVEMMNARAKELGAENTNFVNANGLFDEAHVTTAYDMALITMHAREIPGFMDIVNTPVYDSDPTTLHGDGFHWSTTNSMIVPDSSYYNPYVEGIKTGTLPDAGRCFISTATKDGYTYLLVLMDSPYLDENGNELPQQMAFVDAEHIYDWVFDSFRVKTIVDREAPVSEVRVRLSMEQDHVTLKPADRFTYLLPRDISVTSVTMVPYVPDYLDAPVEKDQLVGELALLLSGEEIGRIPLVAAEAVGASSALVLLERLKAITGSFWVKFALVFLGLLLFLYAALMVVRNRNRRRRRGGYRPRRRI